jgi:hypothetical protein
MFGPQEYGLVLQEHRGGDERPDPTSGDGRQQKTAGSKLTAQTCHQYRRIDNGAHASILCHILWDVYTDRKRAVISTSNGWSFGYDADGNMSSYKGNTLGWTSYNLPSSITAAGQSSQFSHGPNRNRWRQIASYPTGTETTIHVGGILERVTDFQIDCNC